MTENVRRVVTGHNSDGKAIVEIDEIVSNVSHLRPGHSAATIWMTDAMPVDNTDPADGGKRRGAPPKNGSVFRITTYQPGMASRFHRSQVFEYALVLSGGVELVLEDGVSVHLKAGDTLVQRGTMHDWINHGPEPCVMAIINMDALPIKVGDKILLPEG